MRLAELLPEGAGLTGCWEDGCERVELAVGTCGEEVRIYCLTEGELTCEVYDAPWHVACASLEEDEARRLAEVLAGLRGEAGARLAAVVTALFSEGDFRFGDLLDVLDANGIPYAFCCHDPSGFLYRPREACVAADGAMPSGVVA